jgi:hypothetical protein
MMTPNLKANAGSNPEVYPGAALGRWKDTLATLHMWTRIVGKVRPNLARW